VTLDVAKNVTATFTAPPGRSVESVLRSRGRPIVRPGRDGFAVTLRMSTSISGPARVRALRAGRLITTFSFAAAAGPLTIGPFVLAKEGYYTFEVTLGPRSINWTACLGRCGAGATGLRFMVTSEAAAVIDTGAAWSVTVHLHSTLPAEMRLRMYRGRILAVDYHFTPPAGRVSAGPFLVSPGSYTLRLTAADPYGRRRTLTWFAFLP
jgi:hypothetical protein